MQTSQDYHNILIISLNRTRNVSPVKNRNSVILKSINLVKSVKDLSNSTMASTSKTKDFWLNNGKLLQLFQTNNIMRYQFTPSSKNMNKINESVMTRIFAERWYNQNGPGRWYVGYNVAHTGAIVKNCYLDSNVQIATMTTSQKSPMRFVNFPGYMCKISMRKVTIVHKTRWYM